MHPEPEQEERTHPEPEQVEPTDFEPMIFESMNFAFAEIELTDTEPTDTKFLDLEGVGIDWVQGSEVQRRVLADGEFCPGTGEVLRSLRQRVPEQMPASRTALHLFATRVTSEQ